MKNFEEFYEELMNNNKDKLYFLWKESRNESKKVNKIALIVCIILDVVGLAFIDFSNIIAICFAIIIMITIDLIIAVIIYLCFSESKNKNKYTMEFKKSIIEKMINNFYNNLEYFPQKPMPEYIYKSLKYEYYELYSSDDYMEAQINNKYSIQMAEILTMESVRTKNTTTYVTKFCGLF